VRELKKETSSENETVESLKEALETLIKAKEDYETEMLIKVLLVLLS
jgi:hypothetical protein